MDDNICVVCRHRAAEEGHVCRTDRERMREQLTDVPTKVNRLALMLVPGGSAPRGERVSLTRTGSPVGARMEALTLVGPGSADLGDRAVAAMLHPLIRKWSTVHTVDVTVTVEGREQTEQRQVTTWEQELVRDGNGRPVQVLHDDQVGLVPPVEWLESWYGRWAAQLGERLPPVQFQGWPRVEDRRAAEFAEAERRQLAARILLGLRPDLPERWHPPVALPPAEPWRDPLLQEWAIRFGEPERDHAVDYYTAHLLTWLDYVCDYDPDVDEFAAELRALSAELTRVLGEQPDQQWLGRCPATVTARDDSASRPCGAGLWHDPYVAQVECPRCKTTWGPGGIALLRLARDIRRTWPIDRRRRYTLDEIDRLGELRTLRCPACSSPAAITWREVTAVGDKERSWRPDRATCPDGCPEAERLV